MTLDTTPNRETAVPAAALADLVNQGAEALQQGDLDRALDRFQGVVQAFPDRPEGHNNLGALYASLGRTQEAEQCFDRVLDLLPDNPNVRFNRGLMRARRQDYAAATLDFEAALAANPHDAEILNNLGVTAYLKGDMGRARTHLQQALAEDPLHVSALLNLCDLLEASGESADAIDRCLEHLALRNDYPVRRRLLGLLLNRATADLTAAREQALALQALDPADADVSAELARIEAVLPDLRGD